MASKAKTRKMAAPLAYPAVTAPPPATFEPGAQYRIRVNRNVPVGPGHMARPSQAQIVVSGEFANTIKDAISAAEKV